jgi:hypothetical protein
MVKISYYEKLKDPRWQKKRLEVMEHNEFHCEICGDGENTLNVHHKEYFKGHEPWEYDIGQLSCICENCHENEHMQLDLLKWVCSYARLDGPENRTELAYLLAGYIGIPYEGILCFSCMDDNRVWKNAHKAGVTANKLNKRGVHRDYLKEKDLQNGKS